MKLLKTAVPFLLLLQSCTPPSLLPPKAEDAEDGESTACTPIVFDDNFGLTVLACYAKSGDEAGLFVSHDGEHVMSATVDEMCRYICPDDDVSTECLSPYQQWWRFNESADSYYEYSICRGMGEDYEDTLLLFVNDGGWSKLGEDQFGLCY